jgi:hypothetical protein
MYGTCPIPPKNAEWGESLHNDMRLMTLKYIEGLFIAAYLTTMFEVQVPCSINDLSENKRKVRNL